jgi:hypothetical protein
MVTINHYNLLGNKAPRVMVKIRFKSSLFKHGKKVSQDIRIRNTMLRQKKPQQRLRGCAQACR